MKVAIIGSKGYIGRNLCSFLRLKGIEPMCYDVLEGDEDNYMKVDLTDKESVKKIDLNVDYFFFFTGLTGTYVGFDKYNQYCQINEMTLLNLLDEIRLSPYRPKIVFPSSRLVYKGQDKALCEDDEKEAKTIYAANKIACEYYLQAYNKSFDIPYTIFRICVPFGNLIGDDYSFGTIGFFIKAAKTGRIKLYGNGTVKRTFTEIGDLCAQIYKASLLEESNCQTYNIGGVTYSLFEAASIVAQYYGAQVEGVAWPEKDLRIESGSTVFDSTKIELLIGHIEYKSIERILD